MERKKTVWRSDSMYIQEYKKVDASRKCMKENAIRQKPTSDILHQSFRCT